MATDAHRHDITYTRCTVCRDILKIGQPHDCSSSKLESPYKLRNEKERNENNSNSFSL